VGSTATKVVAKLVPHVGGGVTEGEGLAKPVLPHTSRSVTSEDPEWRGVGRGGGHWRNLLLGLARIKKRREKVALSGHEVKNSWGPLKPVTRIMTPVGDWVWANWELVLVQLLAGSPGTGV